MVALPGWHASARFLQGFVHASIGEQIVTPVSRRSVQHPVEQSVLVVQGSSQILPALPASVQVSPSQQGMLAQLRPLPRQRPASAAGLEQLPTVAPASPVQKHDASSKVMHVYAAQYGRSALLPGSEVAPGISAGMHTFPSS
jgi:hypothetical protein